jgi:acyl carrier protein
LTGDAEAVLGIVEDAYREATGRHRTIRAEDLIREDLDIDSLEAMRFLIAVEERLDIELINDPEVWTMRTAGGLLSLIDERLGARG